MLPPVTKEITDHSTDRSFEFIFHCDGCRKEWRSSLIQFSKNAEEYDKSTYALIWQVEHDAAYERANNEAIRNFNRCPKCGRMVCNECFVLDAGSKGEDLCSECVPKQKNKSK
jgi:hypothetical protein